MKSLELSVFLLVSMLSVVSCQSRQGSKPQGNQENSIQEQKEKQATQKNISFEKLSSSIFHIETFDGDRRLERGKGFVVAPGRIVAPYSLFQSSTHAMVSPYQGGQELKLTHYFAIDRINDLIILDAGSIEAEPLKLYVHPKIEGVKTFLPGRIKGNTLPVYTGKCMGEQLIQGNRMFYITNQIDPSDLGIPLFVSTGSVIGLGTFREVAHERTFFAIPSTQIVALLKNEMSSSRALSSLSNPDEKRNSLIRKISLVTDFGNIVIRLYNETPVYRDNFIKLVEEKYYDSLLIHRVIRDFGIQTGAADTRYALADDPVGWKGPGYTLPAHFVKGVIHKRGAIGSPRKPDDRNNERRSDGSQFYIVTGRKYVDEELDKFEKEHGIKYTKEQREFYKTVGGSPHLDGAYTVFGEVVSGMEVADKIANVATHINYRPQKDIRLKKVVIDY